MTNADRIRSMPDEELARAIMCPCGFANADIICTGTIDCVTCAATWLRERIKDDSVNISQPIKHGQWIHTDFLISKILSMSTWLDGTVLVVSRDEVIDIINEMKNSEERKKE